MVDSMSSIFASVKTYMLRIRDAVLAPFIKRQMNKVLKELPDCVVDQFLEMLLKGMGLIIRVDKSYRRNIKNFNGRYCFKTADGKIAASAIFKDNNMRVSEGEITPTNITITFRNSDAMKGFLSSPNPDVINAIMNNDLSYVGNLNYLLKFAYMAKSLQMKLAP